MPFTPLQNVNLPTGEIQPYDAPPLTQADMSNTEEDFVAPEFKQTVETKTLPQEETYSAMGAPKATGFTPIAKPTVTPTPAPVSSGFTPVQAIKPVEKVETNWAGTGPKMSTKEYFKSGFAGRFVSNALNSDEEIQSKANANVLAIYGEGIKKTPQKYREAFSSEFSKLKEQQKQEAIAKAKANPEPGMGESLYELGKQLVTSPYQTAKGLIYELGKDPELLGLGAGTIPTKAVTAAKAGSTLVKGTKSVGATMGKAGVLGVGLETMAETGNPEGYNLQRIANTGAGFAAFAGVTKGALEGAKKVLPARKAVESDIDIEKLNENLNRYEDSLRAEEPKIETFPPLEPVNLPEPITVQEPVTVKSTGHPELTKENFPELSDLTLKDLNEVGHVLEINPERSFVVLDLGNGETLTIRGGVADAWKASAEGERFKESLSDFTKNMNPNSMWTDVDFYNMLRKASSGKEKVTEEPATTLNISDNSETGLPINKGPLLDDAGEPRLDKKGEPRMASLVRDADGNPIRIDMNPEQILKKFNEKPWVAMGHPEDTFKTPEQYAKFILNHEEGHARLSFEEWQKTFSERVDPSKDLRAQYEEHINREAKKRLDAEVEKELQETPALAETGDVFQGDKSVPHTPIEAIKRTIAKTILAARASRIWKESIEAAVPVKKIRERLTMAIEGQKKHDRLLTDEEKFKLLNGTGRQVPGKPYLDLGLKGALQALSRKLQAGGFESQAAYDALAKKVSSLKYVIETLESLPSEEHAIRVMAQIKDQFALIGKQAQAEGVMENLRQNYVPHLLDFSKSNLSQAQAQALMERLRLVANDPKFIRDFSQQRHYQYLRDLEKKVYDTGLELGFDTSKVVVVRDIAQIVEAYSKSMTTALLQKRLTNFLEKQTFTNGKGETLGLITKDLKLGLENGYEAFKGFNSKALDGYLVHPDLVDPLQFMFNQKDPGLALRAASAVSMLSKTITTMASLFHATSLAWARMGATPYGMLKEITKGFSGTRAALEDLRHNGMSKAVDMWTEAGLKIETEDVQRSVVSSVAKSLDNALTKQFTDKDLHITRKVTDPLERAVLEPLNTFTWDFMHAAGKFNTAQYIYTKIKTRHPEMSDTQITKEVASFVNNTFGGLDWLRVADETQNKFVRELALKAFNNRGRAWMQIMMFAPDWTLSTLRSYSKALPKELINPKAWELKKGAKGLLDPTTEGDLARRYVLTTGLLWLTVINGINMAMVGRPIWTNADPTRIDLGDGTTMQLAKHSMEGPHWIMHPLKTAANKTGYIPKTAMTLLSPYVTNPLQAAKAIGEPFVPFQVTAAASAPEGQRLKRGVASFVGFPIYGQTDKAHSSMETLAAKKEKRHQTRMETKQRKLENK